MKSFLNTTRKEDKAVGRKETNEPEKIDAF